MPVVSFFLSGRLSHKVSGPVEHVLNPTIAKWSGDYVYGSYDETWWHNGEVVLKRLQCPVSVREMKLLNVHPGSTIYIQGTAYECLDGGDVELSFSLPGSYQVIVRCWPFLDGDYQIENTSSGE